MNASNNKNDHHAEGIVMKKSTGHCLVLTGDKTILCGLSSQLRKQLVYGNAGKTHAAQRVIVNDHSDPIAVGDRVRYIPAGDDSGMVVEVLPRRSKLSRRSVPSNNGGHTFEQVIAANIDLVIPIFAAVRPAPAWNLLDRNLASAESLNLPALVCITKLDLARSPDGLLPDDLLEVAELYRQIGYEVLFTSSVTGEGIDGLRRALKGRTSVFIGKSGVGKSSLMNSIQPGLGLRVSGVGKETGKGRHTTTAAWMLALDFGGRVIDTPGMREFGLWDTAEDDMALFFREMQPFAGRCKFGLNCLHNEEPGCAVRQAVMDGRIDPRRYRSMLILQLEG